MTTTLYMLIGFIANKGVLLLRDTEIKSTNIYKVVMIDQPMPHDSPEELRHLSGGI
jgi:ABC-type lipopolysaccharide export system ATPase subunit